MERTAISERADERGRHKALLLVGSIGPLGHLPASGTVAVAVAGIPLAWLMRSHLPGWWYWLACGAFTLAAIWLHGVGDRLLGEKDSRKLVWDELAGFFVAVGLMPWTWGFVVLGFLLERAIDIVKVPPANLIEKRWPGGWGVVGDDVVAGVYTLVILLAVERVEPLRVWLGAV